MKSCTQKAKGIFKTVLVLDKRRDRAALKRLRDEIGKIMKTDEFHKRSVAVLGYALNEWELEETCRTNGAVSEPWVRNRETESHCANYPTSGKRHKHRRICLDVGDSRVSWLGYVSVLEVRRRARLDKIPESEENSQSEDGVPISRSAFRNCKAVPL